MARVFFAYLLDSGTVPVPISKENLLNLMCALPNMSTHNTEWSLMTCGTVDTNGIKHEVLRLAGEPMDAMTWEGSKRSHRGACDISDPLCDNPI